MLMQVNATKEKANTQMIEKQAKTGITLIQSPALYFRLHNINQYI